MIYLKKFDNHAQYEAYASSALIRPNVSHCVAEDDMHYSPYVPDYSNKYLTFTALENGTFSFSGQSIQYSLDDGGTWATLASGVNTPTVAAGSKILWKGPLSPTVDDMVGTFSSSSIFDVEGNVMSLLYGDNFVGETSLNNQESIFYNLFADSKVVNAERLLLPATTLADYCYSSMFYGCTSLTTAPELPATTLAAGCYDSMFSGCTSLTTAPELPATTLTQVCYQSMFDNCTSLATAPELPATTLAVGCYGGMFAGCTSLTTAPELPATTLAVGCYGGMFQNCTNLNSITCLATSISAANCTNSWVKGVAASGNFYYTCGVAWSNGTSGIPYGWTRHDDCEM